MRAGKNGKPTMLRKALACLLSAAMVVAFAPAVAWAETTGKPYTFKEGTAVENQNEAANKLIDGNSNTKWCVTGFNSSTGAYIIFDTSSAVSITGYSITTGNDNYSYPGRNPKSWTLSGCNDYSGNGVGTWTEIHTVTDDTLLQDLNNETYYYSLATAAPAYQYFKLEISEIQSGDVMQMSELTLTSCSHSWTTVTKAPTCTEQGYTSTVCSKCSWVKETSSYREPLGHDCAGDTPCSRCGKTEAQLYTFDISQGHVIIRDDANATGKLKVIRSGGYEVCGLDPSKQITVYGSTTEYELKVETAKPVSITVRDLTINRADADSGSYAVVITGSNGSGSATLTLEGESTFKGAASRPGIAVGPGRELTIRGSGSVQAIGGSLASGIGGESDSSCGTVTIISGTVTATGGERGTGIGGGVNGSSFSTGTNGNAVVIASSISDQSGKNNNSWRGVIFENGAGAVYGDTVTPSCDFTIPTNNTLTIAGESTLQIANGVTMTNNGTINVGEASSTGTLTNGGLIVNNAGAHINVCGSNNSTFTNAGTIVNKGAITGAVTSVDGGTELPAVPTANNRTFDGSSQPLVSVEDGANLKYSLNKEVWSETIPTATNAGTYTVYFQAAGSSSANPPSLEVSIAKKAVTVSGITAKDKTYDGTTEAVLDLSNAAIADCVGNDSLGVVATGQFADANAGAGKRVYIRDLALTGVNADNYTLGPNSQSTATADITKASPNVNISASEDSLTGGGTVTLTLSGALKGEGIAVTCSDQGIALVPNSNGTYTATLPNTTRDYTFTAAYAENDNHTASSSSCTVSVYRYVAPPQASTDTTNAINALPDVDELTLESAEDVEAARAAYDALTSYQKSFVPASKLAKLEAAEARIADLAAAAPVEDALEALPELDELTLESAEDVEAARSAYEALTDAQRALVPADALAKLEAAEARCSDLVVVAPVEEALDALPVAEELRAKDAKAAAKAAEAALAQVAELTEAQQALVDEQLVGNAESVITQAAELIAKADAKAADKAKDKKLAVKAGKSKSIAFKTKLSAAGTKVTYKKASGSKYITVTKSGKVTAKKGMKKSKTYTAKVKVTCGKSTRYVKVTVNAR